MFIYVIVCNESLKLYVGQHKKEDLGKYLSQKFFDANRYSGKRSHLYAAMRKHPRDSWSIHPLVSGIETRAELDELEKHFIRVLKTQHPDVGYNICDGGEGFTGPHSEETRRKLSEKLQARLATGWRGALGHKHTDEWRRVASIRARQYTATEETKQKISQALMGHSVSDKVRENARERGKQLVGEKNSFFGKRHSDESKRRNSESHKTPWSEVRRAAYERTAVPKIKPTPEETRQRRSEAAKRRLNTPEGQAHQQRLLVLAKLPKPLRTEEHRRHLRDSLLGRKASPEQILHQSLAQKGRPKPPRSEEYRRHISEAQKKRWAKGIPVEMRERMSEAHKSLPWSEKRRAAFEAKKASVHDRERKEDRVSINSAHSPAMV